MTVGFRPLSACEVDPAFFRIADEHRADDGGAFEYFVLANGGPIEARSYWDLVGLRAVEQDPLVLDVRLMHIDEELLDDEADFGGPEFAALRDASGYVGLGPAGYDALIDLLAAQAPSAHRHTVIGAYFSPMALGDLAEFGFEPQLLRTGFANETRLFRYWPDAGVRSGKQVSFLLLSGWSSANVHAASTSVWFLTIESSPAQARSVHPLDLTGAGLIRLTAPALDELIAILRRHTFS